MNPKIERLINLGKSVSAIARIRKKAKAYLPEFPFNGCATFLSVALREAGIDVPVIVNAEALADNLRVKRGWDRITVGKQMPGDVGVTVDGNSNGMADHIYLVTAVHDADRMTIADNQSARPHFRYASGKGKTRTEFFLRGG